MTSGVKKRSRAAREAGAGLTIGTMSTRAMNVNPAAVNQLPRSFFRQLRAFAMIKRQQRNQNFNRVHKNGTYPGGGGAAPRVWIQRHAV
jgi:hypothetical protein